MLKFFVILMMLHSDHVVEVGVEPAPYKTLGECTEAAAKDVLALGKQELPDGVTEVKGVCLPVTLEGDDYVSE